MFMASPVRLHRTCRLPECPASRLQYELIWTISSPTSCWPTPASIGTPPVGSSRVASGGVPNWATIRKLQTGEDLRHDEIASWEIRWIVGMRVKNRSKGSVSWPSGPLIPCRRESTGQIGPDFILYPYGDPISQLEVFGRRKWFMEKH
jgi:hypothetical protein